MATTMKTFWYVATWCAVFILARQLPFVDNLTDAESQQAAVDEDRRLSPEASELFFELEVSVEDSIGKDNLEPMLIPLHREVVPIRREGKIVTYKTSYSGGLNLGVPAQEFRVVFDTGSGHVVVPAAGCQSEACVIHKRYSLSASETGAPINSKGKKLRPWDPAEQISIGFGTGLIKSQLAQERVCLGLGNNDSRHPRDRRECLDMRMMMAVEMSDNPFLSFVFDGIVGLGLPMLSLTDEFSFFHLMSQSGRLANSQFGFFLTEGEDNEESELAIGGVNPTRILGSPVWSPVLMPDEGHWLVAIKAVRVDGELLDICQDGSCRAVVDTGTSHIGVPAAHLDTLDKLLTRDAGDFLDCRLAESSVLEFEMDAINLTLSAENYMRRIPLREGVDVGNAIVSEDLENAAGDNIEDNTDIDANATEKEIRRHCSPRLMGVDMPAPLGPKLWILGEPLVQKYYTVYDWAKLQVGFTLANSRRNTMPRQKGKGSLPKDIAAEGHLLLQRPQSRRDAIDTESSFAIDNGLDHTCL